MSRYFAAIDACVAAAGYNAFHELIALAVPSLYVPMPRRTDDQPARSRWASRGGPWPRGRWPGGPRACGADRRAPRAARLDPCRAHRSSRAPRSRRRRCVAEQLDGPTPGNSSRRGPAALRLAHASSAAGGAASSRACRRRRGGSDASNSPSPRRTPSSSPSRSRATLPPRSATGSAGRERGPSGYSSSPTRCRRSVPSGRLAAGSSTFPRAALERPSSPAATYETFRAGRLELILRERPKPRRDRRGAGRRFGTLRAALWRPLTPKKPHENATSGLADATAGALPNLIVIGAQKCGTSVLHYYLSLHPEVSMSRPKELNFFIEERNWPRGVDWYKAHFDADAPCAARPRPTTRPSLSTRACPSAWPRSSPTRS